MTSYSATARTALERELAAPDDVVLTEAWFPGPVCCERCGAALVSANGLTVAFSLTDWVAPAEPGQFWQERLFHVCRVCAEDITYAADRLARRRGVRSGKLPTWGNTVKRRRKVAA
jgi:hypothetical protein